MRSGAGKRGDHEEQLVRGRTPWRRRRVQTGLFSCLLLLAGFAIAALAAPERGAAVVSVCNRYASPSGSDSAAGTAAAPFRTVGKLVGSLASGEAGCLAAGTYTGNVSFNATGVTLRSVPDGDKATIKGRVYVPESATDVTLEQVVLDGSENSEWSIVQVFASRFRLLDSEVTALSTGHNCVLIAGGAEDVEILRNVIHDCGIPNQNSHVHGIYVQDTVRALIADNVFLRIQSGFAIHFWTNGDDAIVEHNVLESNKGGVIIAGSSSYVSDRNLIRRNVITNSVSRDGVSSYWSSAPGVGNVVEENCFWANENENLSGSGYTARNNTIADPLYIDPTAGDYRLAATSPCAGMGPRHWNQNEPELPSALDAPTITGTLLAGSALTADPGAWSGSEPISFDFQWRRCDANGGGCSAIAGASQQTHALTSEDVGSTLRVLVSASNEAGTAAATSAATAPVSAPPPTPPSFRSSASSIVSWNTQWAVNRPSGVEEGDLLLACVSTRKRVPASAPAGWTLVREDASPQGVGVAAAQRVYVKQAGASEPSSYTFTAPEPVSGATVVAAYTGVDPVSPVAGSSGEYRFQPGSAYARAPGLTVGEQGVLLVGCYGHNGRRGAFPPTDASERADRWSSVYSTLWLGLELSDEELAGMGDPGSPGESIATGERAALDETLTNYAYTIGQLVALRPSLLGQSEFARLYSDSSPFNQRISAGAAVDPNSQTMVQTIVESVAAKGFTVSVQSWTVPVYYADTSTPRYDVALTAAWAPGDSFRGVPIPTGAQPDPEADGHMTIIDRSAGCEYDYWQVKAPGGGWEASWGNSLRTDGSGVYPLGLSARGSGFASLAGLIWPEELARGRIDHALIFAYPDTKAGGPVSPATESDGVSSGPGAIPIGARVQLDPSLDLDTLGLSSHERTIARALQDYGMYLADSSGNTSLYAVSPLGYESNPYAGQMPTDPIVFLMRIPVDRFRVLLLPPQVANPTYDIVPSGCGEIG